MSEHLLGLDWGGGGGRALLVDVRTRATHTARRAWRPTPHPDAGPLGWGVDLEGGLRALADATREVLAAAGVGPADVSGVAAASVRFADVVLGPGGDVIDVAANRDARATGEALRLAADHGAALHAASGHWPQPILPLARLVWLAARRADLAASGAQLIAVSDWVAYRLCGRIATEPSQASASGLFDPAARRWLTDWVERLDLPPSALPDVVPSGTRLGALAPAAAQLFGLAAGTPVVAGGSDSACALLGCGAVEDGARLVLAGTTAPVLAVSSRPCLDPRVFTECHVAADRWMTDSNAGPVGETLAWLATVLFEGDGAVARLLAAADASPPGAAGVLSSLAGQVLDARQLALPVGHLTVSPVVARAGAQGRADLARATVEGLAFAVRANLEQLERVCGRRERGAPGPSAGTLGLAGGASRSATLARVLADVTGQAVEAGATPDASALGAAMCAGAGVGLFADLDGAAAGLHRSGARHEPDPARAALYADLYAAWGELGRERSTFDARAAQQAIRGFASAQAGDAVATAPAGHRPRILATCDLDAGGRDALGRLGELEYASYRERGRLLTGPALVDALEGAEVFVTEIDLVDAAALAARPELRVVASCRGDAVNVDLAACTAHGVPVLNTPGRNADAVADLTVAFLLMLARRLPEATAFLRAEPHEAGDMGRMGRAFGALRGHELGGRTVGLVGFGAVGRGVARRLLGFGARVLACDPPLPDERILAAGAEPVTLDALLAASDLVSLHAPVTEATRDLIGAEELARMRKGAALVNTARAALVDEDALAAVLASGHLSGAALDVFSVEPPGSDHPLLQRPEVVATPHVGGNTHEVAAHQGRLVAEDLERLLRGERPHHVRNPEVLERFDWAKPRPLPDAATLEALAAAPPPTVTDLERDAAPRRRRAAAATAGNAAPPSQPGALAPETRRRMDAILERFVAGAVGCDAIRAFAADRDVTLAFRVPDLERVFHLRLRRGQVSGGVRPPDAEPEVTLTLGADVLDGMFTGRVNPMQAAMDGRLAFTGDTAKAMTIQHLQEDLSRLYREARDAVGDPGDLAAGAPGVAAAGEVPDDDPRRELIGIVGELYAQQLITATGGNVSVRDPAADRIWITPSQMWKGGLEPGMLVALDLEGRPLEPTGRAPSSERMIHCAVYAARPEARAVVHAHAAHATILANAELPFVPISTEAAFFGNIPRVPFLMPGTDALARAVGEAIEGEWAVLMKNHGLIVAGRSLRRAADMVEIIERSAEVILGCYAVGREPPALPADVVAELRALGDLVA